MEEKMLDPDFLGDTQNLIRPDREFNPRLGYELVWKIDRTNAEINIILSDRTK